MRDDDHLKEIEKTARLVERSLPETDNLDEDSEEAGETLIVDERHSVRLVEQDYFETAFSAQYHLLRVVGKGASGTVYEAYDRVLDRRVAIKLLPELLSEDQIIRFQNEGRNLSKVVHKAIATVHNLGVSKDGRPFIIMEFIDGQSLADIIKNEGPLNPHWAVHIQAQLLTALKAAHDAGITHRDLKPENIMIARTNEGIDFLKLIDFGIARFQDSEITRTGVTLGSPLYMSPEQCKGSRVDQRSDIYSAGCILHEMLTGSPPFRKGSTHETMQAHVGERHPLLPREYRRIQKILDKALSKNADDRFQNAYDFMMSLVSKWSAECIESFIHSPIWSVAAMRIRSKRDVVKLRTYHMMKSWIFLLLAFSSGVASALLPRQYGFFGTAMTIICVIFTIRYVLLAFKDDVKYPFGSY